MRIKASVDQSQGRNRAAHEPTWRRAAALAIVLGALGCGSPFLGLAASDETPDADAATDRHDASAGDAAQARPDTTRDITTERRAGIDVSEAGLDSSKGDVVTTIDAVQDRAVDEKPTKEAGYGPSGDSAVDRAFVPDAVDIPEAGLDRDVRGADGRADASRVDAASDVSVVDAGTDDVDAASVDAGSGAADGIDDADAGAACGLAPPPPGGACPAVCNDGCAEGVCRIACRGEQECKKATIQCPPGFACDISCAGKQSCDAALLVCPDIYACRLLCAGEQSCKAIDFNCRSGICQLSCSGTSQVCESATVNCGEQACTATCNPAESRPTVNCGASCDCRPCL
jgi:hypothetical protein